MGLYEEWETAIKNIGKEWASQVPNGVYDKILVSGGLPQKRRWELENIVHWQESGDMTYGRDSSLPYKRCFVKSAILWGTETSCHGRAWGNSMEHIQMWQGVGLFVYPPITHLFSVLVGTLNVWDTFSGQALLACVSRAVYLKMSSVPQMRKQVSEVISCTDLAEFYPDKWCVWGPGRSETKAEENSVQADVDPSAL